MKKMDCSSCGGKLVKAKYLNYEELQGYLSMEYIASDIENYKDWLMSLEENDLVLTCFKRKDYKGVKEKYYLRLVEKKTKAGLKLKKLSKTFKFETGELVYGKNEDIFSSMTTYKILLITEHVDKIIRDYCKNEDEFDIDNLNKIITKLY
jgi:hypothetical protein